MSDQEDDQEFTRQTLLGLIHNIEEQITLHPQTVVEANEIFMGRIIEFIEGLDNE